MSKKTKIILLITSICLIAALAIAAIFVFDDKPIALPLGHYEGAQEPWPSNITIHSIDKSKITFSASWYRAWGFEYATVEIINGVGDFMWQHEESSSSYAKGTFKIIDDEHIELTITEASFDVLGTYTYEHWTEEDLRNDKIAYDKMVLLMNTDKKGWFAETGQDEGGYDIEKFFRFYEDGKYIGWIVKRGLNDHIFKYEGKYKVEYNTLYLDGNAYELYTYTAGDSTMNIDAKGNYPVDFSGDYTTRDDTLYNSLIAEVNVP